eukprot:3254799-Prymnesium_polylepis.1
MVALPSDTHAVQKSSRGSERRRAARQPGRGARAIAIHQPADRLPDGERCILAARDERRRPQSRCALLQHGAGAQVEVGERRVEAED